MTGKGLIEVFTAGCHICNEVVEEIKAAACPSCEVKIYDLNAGCETDECKTKAKAYGIKSVPAVVIGGRLSDCCKGGGVNIETLRSAGLGQPL